MRDAVIVAAVRTPVGKRNGGLAGIHPADLAGEVLGALATRAGVDPGVVEDVYLGCVSQVGEQSWNIARNAVLAAGWPEHIPGTTIDRQCGSSQQALHFAAAAVVAGQADAVVAAGVESMSRVPMGSSVSQGAGAPYGDKVRERYADVPGVAADQPIPFNQGVGAEMLAERWKLTRGDLDAFALESHARAAAATDRGVFDAEIVPVAGVKADEGIRRDSTLETLAGLKTPFKADGVISAGNASQISDGAAALLVMTSQKAAELGVTPLVRVHSTAVVGSDPVVMLDGPIPATAKVLARAGLSIGDIGAYEVNEAFAPVPLGWLAETGADPARMNPNGGAIALGHPLGATGARLATSLVHHMKAQGIRYGLQTMCEGGGMANATIFENVAA